MLGWGAREEVSLRNMVEKTGIEPKTLEGWLTRKRRCRRRR